MTFPQNASDGPFGHAPVPPEEEGDLSETLDRVRLTLIRYRWLILLTTSAVALATVAVLRTLPNRYTSEATLVVVQQRVPERYVVPTTTTPVAAELRAMQLEALSHTQLQEVIRLFHLYPTESARLAPEQIIELMQKDIQITPVGDPTTSTEKDLNAFKIAFTAATPVLAQQVTSMLTSLIVQQNLKTRSEQAAGTTSFLHDQLETAKKGLIEQEQRLKDYKMQNLGELPEQQAGNLGILTSLQARLQNTMATMSRAQEQRAYLESLLSGYQTMSARTAPLPAGSGPDATPVATPVELAQRNLVKLQAEKAALLTRYLPAFPDVISKDREIAAAQAALEQLKVNASNTSIPKTATESKPAAPPSRAVDQSAVAQVRSQLEANRLEMENLSKEETQLKASLAQYENRLNLTPVREQQLTGMLRDYDIQKKNYADLVNKELQSQLATNLEKDQGGRQFRLIDPPSLPVVPSSPKRLKINLSGAVGGLFLGLAFAFFLAMRDRSFHTEKQLSQRFSLPLVVGVPMLLTPSEKRSSTWRTSFEWLAGSVLALAVCAVEFYAYHLG
jgi:protein tyrosine kinase modulator